MKAEKRRNREVHTIKRAELRHVARIYEADLDYPSSISSDAYIINEAKGIITYTLL